MKSLITLIFRRLHLILLFYTGWNLYDQYLQNEEVLQNIILQIDSAQVRLTQSKKRLQEAIEYQKDLEKGKNNLVEATKLLTQVQSQLPITIDDTIISDSVNAKAQVLNIQDVVLNPLIPVNNDWYFSKKYEVKMRATFLQFLVFFEQLSQTERIYNVPKIKIQKQKSISRSRFQLLDLEGEIELYRLNPDYDANADIEKQLEENKKNTLILNKDKH